MSAVEAEVTVIVTHALNCADQSAVESIESPFKLGPLDLLAFPAVPVDNVFCLSQSFQ